MQNTIPTIPHISTAPRMHFATACAMFHELAQKYATPYIKIAMENIVVPSMASYGFASAQVPCVRTKEVRDGKIYLDGHMVVRIIDGYLVDESETDTASSGVVEEGKEVYDAYGWKATELASNIAKGGSEPIGRASAVGLANFARLYSTIKTDRDRERFCRGFVPYGIDLLLVHTPAENRACIEVTQELYDAGLRYCADDWRASDAKKDAEGMVETTPLCVGDLIAISDIGAYVVAAKVARQTYRKVI